MNTYVASNASKDLKTSNVGHMMATLENIVIEEDEARTENKIILI